MVNLNPFKILKASTEKEGITFSKSSNIGASVIPNTCNLKEYPELLARQIIRNITAECFDKIPFSGKKQIDKGLFIDAFVNIFKCGSCNFWYYDNGNEILDIIFNKEDLNDKIKIKPKEVNINCKTKDLWDLIIRLLTIHANSLIKMNNQLNISNASVLKIAKLRENQINTEENIAELRGAVDKAFSNIESGNGRVLILDGEDILEHVSVNNLTEIAGIRDEVFSELSIVLNLPLSYFNGTFKSGLGNGNGGDIEYRELGIKNFTLNYILPFLHILKLKWKNIKANTSIERLFKVGSESNNFIISIQNSPILDDNQKKKILNEFLKSKGLDAIF